MADVQFRINIPEEKINTSSLDSSDHSIQSSPIEQIPRTYKPVNHFRNQLYISHSDIDEVIGSTVFPNYHVHEIKFTSIENLLTNLVHSVFTQNINAIHTTDETFFEIKDGIKNKFPTIKFIYNPIETINITNRNEQLNTVEKTHIRAHRNFKDNILETSQYYSWLEMKKDCKRYAAKCEICLTEKYERHPK